MTLETIPFDEYDPVKKTRVGIAFGSQFIANILKTVGVESWEQLVGKHVRVETEDWGRILRIGHIVENRWFDPKELLLEEKE